MRPVKPADTRALAYFPEPGRDKVSSAQILSPAASREYSGRIDTLTSLRFYAAIGVAIMHSQIAFGPNIAVATFFTAQAGVSFFFVLSGFVLTYTYRRLNSRRSIFRFWLARFARIWPAHVVAILLLVLSTGYTNTAGMGARYLPITILANLFLVQSWIPYTDFWLSLNGVAWSISDEFFFYAVFPILLWALWQARWRAFAIILGVVVFFIALCAVASLPVLELGRIDAAALLYANPLVRIFEFYIGMLSYPLLVALRPMVLRMSPWLATVAEAVVIAFFLCLIYRPLHTVLFSGTGNFAKMAAVYAGKSGGSAPAAALLIVVFAAQRGAVSKFLQLPICIFLGEISYAFYLVHAIVLAWYAPQESGDYFSWDAPAAYVHYWTTCLSVSSALYLCVERPCRAAIRHLPDMRLADLRTVLSIRFLRRQAASTYACACYAALLVVGVDFWLGHLYLSPVKH